jgi:hypothetical protein
MSDREIIERIASKLGLGFMMQGLTTEACVRELTAICGGTMPRTLDELKGKLRSSIVVLLCPHIETALSAQDEEDLWRVLTSNEQKR